MSTIKEKKEEKPMYGYLTFMISVLGIGLLLLLVKFLGII